MKRLLLVAAVAASIGLPAVPAFANDSGGHDGGRDGGHQGAGDAGSGDARDDHYHDHDRIGELRESRRAEIGGGPSKGK